MHRIERDDLRRKIVIAIQTLRAGKGGKGRHPMPEFRDNWNVEKLADRIMDQIDGDSRMVVSTEMIGFNTHSSHGKWGIDEPWPEGCDPGAAARRFPPPASASRSE